MTTQKMAESFFIKDQELYIEIISWAIFTNRDQYGRLNKKGCDKAAKVAFDAICNRDGRVLKGEQKTLFEEE